MVRCGQVQVLSPSGERIVQTTSSNRSVISSLSLSITGSCFSKSLAALFTIPLLVSPIK